MEETPKRNRKKQVSTVAIQHGLTDKEIAFANLYANSPELRGNGVQCYAKAFGLNLSKPGSYNTAKTNASKLLSNLTVLNYIQSIFDNDGLNETVVMGELAFCIKQLSDMNSKVAAIRLYLDLQGKLRQKEATPIKFQVNILPSILPPQPKDTPFDELPQIV